MLRIFSFKNLTFVVPKRFFFSSSNKIYFEKAWVKKPQRVISLADIVCVWSSPIYKVVVRNWERFQLVYTYYQHRQKILPKSYIHITRPRQKVSNQSMSSENILLKRRVEVFDRVYLLFNLVTSNESFFNLRHLSIMRHSSLLKMLAMSYSS